MTKVGRSDCEGTVAGTRDSDKDAPIPVVHATVGQIAGGRTTTVPISQDAGKSACFPAPRRVLLVASTLFRRVPVKSPGILTPLTPWTVEQRQVLLNVIWGGAASESASELEVDERFLHNSAKQWARETRS